MSDRSISRIRLHRAVECRKVEPYQYADCPQRTGDDLCHTGKDNAYQPLPDQPKLVPGRSSRIRLRQTRTKRKRPDTYHHRRLHPRTGTDDQPVCTDRQSPGTAENRLGIYGMAGRKRHPFLHHLHQSRQTERRTSENEYQQLPA